jgi:hypothetical protein
LTFAIVDGSNNMGSIYIINTKWWSDLKRDKKIHSFWTFDGRIFAKKDANGRKQLNKCVQDIAYLINSD